MFETVVGLQTFQRGEVEVHATVQLLQCQKPVIGAVHGACVGGGINLISSTDIRYCTTDAWFQVKEVDLGMYTFRLLYIYVFWT